jgi:hypothetical protein
MDIMSTAKFLIAETGGLEPLTVTIRWLSRSVRLDDGKDRGEIRQ